jgi:hypothetical protein
VLLAGAASAFGEGASIEDGDEVVAPEFWVLAIAAF